MVQELSFTLKMEMFIQLLEVVETTIMQQVIFVKTQL